ncbi:MAG: response regulator transcription factor [Oscillospiraceae bacterium]
MPKTVFVIEDDESIRKLLEIALNGCGFTPKLFEMALPALAQMEKDLPDAVIFDIMLDGMSGIDAVKQMRKTPTLCDIPVVLLTARDTENDKITGLDAGADDYITKPFSILELTARLRAVMRRNGKKNDSDDEILSANKLTLKTQTREIFYDGNAVDVTFKEFELLYILMKNDDRALSREKLLEKVWGFDYVGETRTLDIHIGTLRKKLAAQGADPECIATVRGIGYRFKG